MPKISVRAALKLGAATFTLSFAILGADAPAAVAATAPSAEAELLNRTNAARAAAGLGALAPSEDLVAVARRHAQRMADAGRIFHNGNLPNEVTGWKTIGENVGRAPSVAEVHDAFMASPAHRANIVRGDFTQAGMGIVEQNGELWVVEVFRQPAAARPASAPAAPASPRPAPVPGAKPAPVVPAPVAAGAPVAPTPVAVRPAPVIERVVPQLPPAPTSDQATSAQLITEHGSGAPTTNGAALSLAALLLLGTVAGMTTRRVATQLAGPRTS